MQKSTDDSRWSSRRSLKNSSRYSSSADTMNSSPDRRAKAEEFRDIFVKNVLPKSHTLHANEIGSYIRKVMAVSDSELQIISQGIRYEYINLDLIKQEKDSQTQEYKKLSEQDFIQQVEAYKEMCQRPDTVDPAKYIQYTSLVQQNASQVLQALPKISEEQIRTKTIPLKDFGKPAFYVE